MDCGGVVDAAGSSSCPGPSASMIVFMAPMRGKVTWWRVGRLFFVAYLVGIEVLNMRKRLGDSQLTFGSLHVSYAKIHPRGTAPTTRAALECKLSQCGREVQLKLVRDVLDPKIQESQLVKRI